MVRAFFRKPDAFVESQFSVKLWEKQREILQALVDHKRVAVRACNDVGKSFAVAGAALWFLLCRPPCAVITTAPTWAQVTNIVWREIAKLWARRLFISDAEPLQTMLRIAPDQFAMGISTNQMENFQGFREQNVLFIVDEASGVDERIIEAIEGSMQSEGARLLMVGNPTRTSGPFYDAFHGRASALFHKIHISAFDYIDYVERTGHYTPPLVTRRDVEEKAALWGEDSDLFRIRVLGEFPAGEPGLLFSPSLLEQARRYVVENPVGPIEFGIDPADQGGDETAVCARQGDAVLFIESWNTRTQEETWGKIVGLIERFKPAVVRVDYPGVGVGVATYLQKMQRERNWRTTRIIPVRSGAAAHRSREFRKVSDELWFELAERFRAGRVSLARLPEHVYNVLCAQLTSRTAHVDASNIQYLQPKKQLRAQGIASPDRADALALAFYEHARGWSMLDEYIE